jgi:hypothetical protein
MRLPYSGVLYSPMPYSCHSGHQRLFGSQRSKSLSCLAMNSTVYIGLTMLGGVLICISATLTRYHFGLKVPVTAYLIHNNFSPCYNLFFFQQEFQDFRGELAMPAGQTQVLMNRFSVVSGDAWGRRVLKVKWKPKLAAHCSSTVDHTGAVNWSTIPRVSSKVTSWYHYCASCLLSVIGCDGDGFVEESVETLNSEGPMVSSCDGVASNLEVVAHIPKSPFERAALTNSDYHA